MSLSDALIVAFSGYGVVFLGLVTTSLIIYSFTVIPRIIEHFSSKKKDTAESESVATPDVATIDEDVLAVITTVVEIERRLYMTNRMSRYTFKERRGAGLI